ncbi:MAG: hypothetical protein KKE89_09155 [Actinobacteria bacterium]|nr:hypothetical protein [Actinomycetota bacterium]
MHKTSEIRYATRCAFQNDLDRAFPNGAVCALLPVEGHRVQTRVGRVESTGRLFCSDVRPSPGNGGWDYEILIDARSGRGETAEELRVWVGALTMHSTARGLWEAPVRSDHGEMLLRLTPGAVDGGAAGPALRKAVTIAHEHELFPEGILA